MPEDATYSCQKAKEFKQLRVMYRTGRNTDTTQFDGFKRNGKMRYKSVYRSGMMTELGDIEEGEWVTKAMALIEKYKEEQIYRRLLKGYTFPFFSEKEAQIYALELHMARIFEDPEWVCYGQWHKNQ